MARKHSSPTLSRVAQVARTLAFAAGAATTLGLTAPLAMAAAEAPTLSVQFGDLNLTQPADANVLYRRLQVAAERVCGTRGSRELSERIKQKECRAQSIARAVQDIDAPLLTAMHDSRAQGASGAARVADRR